MENLDEYKKIMGCGYKIIEVKTNGFRYNINTKEKLVYIPPIKEKSKLIEILREIGEEIN